MIPDDELKNGRILIVDDKKANVLLLEGTLASDGYQAVLSTTNPCDCIDLFISFQPDLILLDLNMPDMDGFEVMERLKCLVNSDYLPVLVLTAFHDRTTRLRALQVGARDFISKPFDTREILCRIRNLLEVTLSHRRVRDHNKLLDRQVREKTRELHDTRLEIIRRLGLAAEFKDRDTANHIIRMSQICQILADAYGVSNAHSELLLTASPMHDVGKIGIPDQILLKPGKLDAQEWQIMQTHTEIGYRLLDGHSSELMETAKQIALSHHERWDGNGYPFGLAGDEIPFNGRICAIADVFDALTSLRPYKQPWSYAKAAAEIESQRGRQFDPELVDTFTGIKEIIFEICHACE